VLGEVLGDVLSAGRSDGIVDGDGEVGGDAEGVRSRLGLAPMPPWFESVQPANVNSATAHSPERSFLIVTLLRRSHSGPPLGFGAPRPLFGEQRGCQMTSSPGSQIFRVVRAAALKNSPVSPATPQEKNSVSYGIDTHGRAETRV
jgi:hypothetical protein